MKKQIFIAAAFIAAINASAQVTTTEALKVKTKSNIKNDKAAQPASTENASINLTVPVSGKMFTTNEVKNTITFRWTPLVPKPQQPVTYRLKVWQLMQGQTGTQAMRTNKPIITKDVNDKTEFVKPNLMGDIEMIGGTAVEIDFQPFIETAQLLYEGPWVAERYAAIKDFFDTKPEAIFPTTHKIISNAAKFSAADTYKAMYKLKALQRKAAAVLDDIDVLVTPTAGTIYSIAEVENDPVQTNTNLGYYTNFMNLLDMAAIAVPTGFYENGIGFGITISAPAFSDKALLNLAQRLEQST